VPSATCLESITLVSSAWQKGQNITCIQESYDKAQARIV